MRTIFAFLSLCFSFSASANPHHPNMDLQQLTLQKAYLQAIDCRAPQKITNMLSLALKDADDYAAKASNASVLEELMLKNPPCFINALNQLPIKACEQFKGQFIEETFFYPRDEIKSALATAKNYSKSCIAN